MRIFQAERRIVLTGTSDEALFAPELEYYSNHNQYPVTLFGKPIVNLYRNINVQILITRACNFKCKFCIENDGIKTKNDGSYWLGNLVHSTLSQYREQGIMPNVSITGGEPTLLPNRLFNILDIVKSYHGIKNVNVNTNGYDLSVIRSFPGVRINLSRHHWWSGMNRQIFGDAYTRENVKDFSGVTLQCVLMQNYVNSVPMMKEYMDRYIDKGADGFSFRGLTTLDVDKGYQVEKVFSEQNVVDIKVILDTVAKDADFEFVQQKIGDHYIFEIYKYRGKYVRFTYSNFNWLRQIETDERKSGKSFSRATVIHPNAVYSGWTYDLNKLVTK